MAHEFPVSPPHLSRAERDIRANPARPGFAMINGWSFTKRVCRPLDLLAAPLDQHDIEAAGAGVVTAPEPVAIARALERLISDDALRRNMGARGRAFAELQYSTAVMAERLIALYEDIRCRRSINIV